MTIFFSMGIFVTDDGEDNRQKNICSISIIQLPIK